jgi:outer membrane protein assembly factor BamE (lipoprotein component of BamABCDE complex)
MTQMKSIKIIIAIVGALSLIILPGQVLSAEEESVTQLLKKISKLEDRVRQLEGLLEKCSTTGKGQTADECGWQNKKNWRRLQLGMAQAQVRSILGEPIKIIKGTRTLWYYPNIYCAYVSFDNNGLLSGWNEP